MSDPALHFGLLAAAAAASALYLLYRCLACVRRDRTLADTPLVRIRSAAQGYVKVAGRAKYVDGIVTAAPLSARPCVWWNFEIEEKRENSKGETHWHEIERAASVAPFAIADADGECLVGPVNAEITPTSRNVWYGDSARPAGLAGAWRLAGSGSSHYRYTERLLCAGDALSVVGELRSHSELHTDLNAVGALLVEWKHDQVGLLARFDTNRDGRIDAAEWEAARVAAASETQSQALTTPIGRTSVIAQSTNGEPFIIAALDSDRLVRREQLHAAIFLVLGLICVGLCAIGIEHVRAARRAAVPAPSAATRSAAPLGTPARDRRHYVGDRRHAGDARDAWRCGA